jgi:stage III sporulation protein SpoIIIAA
VKAKPPLDHLDAALRVLPGPVQAIVAECQDWIEELVLDVGRPVAVKSDLQVRRFDYLVTPEKLVDIEIALGGFRPEDGRAGVPGALHRFSGEREYGTLNKITVRFARVIQGLAEPLRPHLVGDEGPRSTIFVGGPGVGKTSTLRSAIWIYQSLYGEYVVVVDSANELGGDSPVPHPTLGNVRRFRVADPRRQAEVIYRAVTNHYPLVVVIDELRRKEDVVETVEAIRRGVKPVASVHGHDLAQVIENEANWPALGLERLPGGVRRVRRPVFEQAVLLPKRGVFLVYPDLARALDQTLAGEAPTGLVPGGEDAKVDARAAGIVAV